MAELALSRARPVDAERIHCLLLTIAPSPAELLALDRALERLERLGLKSDKARLLVDVAEAINELFAGEVPDDQMDLAALPGAGDYVCRAVLTFGFGRRQVLVDRTTSRVASRVTGHGDGRRFQLRLDLHRLSGAEGPDAQFNRALLDLGRSICTPADPRCGLCPLRMRCVTGRDRGTENPLVATLGLDRNVSAA
jgi:A/G-specific adenine glycosylase